MALLGKIFKENKAPGVPRARAASASLQRGVEVGSLPVRVPGVELPIEQGVGVESIQGPVDEQKALQGHRPLGPGKNLSTGFISPPGGA
jgi:hypothetical protein